MGDELGVRPRSGDRSSWVEVRSLADVSKCDEWLLKTCKLGATSCFLLFVSKWTHRLQCVEWILGTYEWEERRPCRWLLRDPLKEWYFIDLRRGVVMEMTKQTSLGILFGRWTKTSFCLDVGLVRRGGQGGPLGFCFGQLGKWYYHVLNEKQSVGKREFKGLRVLLRSY